MIRNVKLEINGRDFSNRLSTYSPDVETTYGRVVTTIDGTEHVGGLRLRDIITFSIWPFDQSTAQADFEALSKPKLLLTCTAPTAPGGELLAVPARLASDLSNAFALNSVDGKIYYKGGEITLRALKVR